MNSVCSGSITPTELLHTVRFLPSLLQRDTYGCYLGVYTVLISLYHLNHIIRCLLYVIQLSYYL